MTRRPPLSAWTPRVASWLAVGVLLLAVAGLYHRTMHPGVAGHERSPLPRAVHWPATTPLLQAGDPEGIAAAAAGSPLLRRLAPLWASVPLGSRAYRFNLLSGLLATTAALLLYAALRAYGCRRRYAVVAGVAFAWGRLAWGQATVAGADLLPAVLVLAALLALVRWPTARCGRYPLLALLGLAAGATAWIGVAALLVPAGFYIARVDRTFLVRPVGAAAAIAAVGIASLAVSGDVWLAPGSVAEAATALFLELWAPGLALALGGVWATIAAADRRDAGTLLLFTTVAALVAALLTARPQPDLVLLPAVALLWVAAGIGLDRAARWMETRYPSWVTVGGACLLPAFQLTANFHASDRSSFDTETRYVDRLVASLDAGTVVVSEEPILDAMVRYGVATDPRPVAERARIVPRDADAVAAALAAGRPVIAFERAAAALSLRGTSPEALVLLDRPLREHLARQPAGSTVALVGPAAWLTRAPAETRRALAAYGAVPPMPPDAAFAMVGVRGGRLPIVETGPDVSIDLAAGARVGRPGMRLPVAIRLRGTETASELSINGQLVDRVRDGVAIVVVEPRTGFRRLTRALADDGFRVPFARATFRLHPAPCVAVSAGQWHDVTRVTAGGRVTIRGGPSGAVTSLTLRLGRDRTLRPRAFHENGARVPFALRETAGPTTPAPEPETTVDAPAVVYELVFVVAADPIVVNLGGVPDDAIATLGSGAAPASLCRAPVAAPFFERAPLHALALDGRSPVFGHGWNDAEPDGGGVMRWTAADAADLLVPLARTGTVRLRVYVNRVLRPGGPETVAVRVNDYLTPARRLAPDPTAHEWEVPADAWRVGLNDLAVVAPGASRPPGSETRTLGIGVRGIELALLD